MTERKMVIVSHLFYIKTLGNIWFMQIIHFPVKDHLFHDSPSINTIQIVRIIINISPTQYEFAHNFQNGLRVIQMLLQLQYYLLCHQ